MKFEVINEYIEESRNLYIKVTKKPEELKRVMGDLFNDELIKDNYIYFRQNFENKYYVVAFCKDDFECGCNIGNYIRNSKLFEKFIVDLNEENLNIKDLIFGIRSKAYIFDLYKSQKEKEKIIKFFIKDNKKYSEAKKYNIYMDSTYIARNLALEPPNVLNPETFEKRVYELFKGLPVMVKTLYEDDLKKEGLNLILAVGRGSKYKPRMLIIEYKNSNDRPIVLIGKGVTFDTGGYQIKPSQFMLNMHADMSGAAAVIGSIYGIAKLQMQKYVIGIIPLVENRVSSNSYLPNEIIKAYNGKYVEIKHTDAEGRLILADAIAYASNFNPKYIIDIATLTGGQIIALGTDFAALYGNYNRLEGNLVNEAKKLIETIKKAGEFVREYVWEMPLHLPYLKELLKSNVADIINTSLNREAHSIQGALFLSEFTNYPWAHLDIAGPAIPEREKPWSPYGITGWGARILIKTVELL